MSSFQRGPFNANETLDASIIGMASGRLSAIPAARRPLPQNSSLVHDISITLAPHEFELFGNQTMLSKTLSQGNWSDAWDRLHIQFLESFLSHGSEQNVFDMIADYIQNCTDTLDILLEKYTAGSKDKDQKDILWLRNERNTWKLLYCLYQNRLSSQHRAGFGSSGNDQTFMDVDGVCLKKHQSEKDVVDQLYENDPVVRECQLVIDWLEKCAADLKVEMGGPEIGHFTDKIVAWENTLLQLKMNKERDTSIAYGASRNIVSKLDPDAPIRENKSLHDLDWEDEARLMQQVFSEIRCGRLEAAQQLCCHCGQPWRAAALEGWRLLHDPNYEGTALEAGPVLAKMPIEGNPNRDLWKVCAWRMSEDYKMPAYTRATQGALCGNLDALLPVCSKWDDVLWAYLRVFVDIRVERELRSQLSFYHSYAEMPEKYSQKELGLEEIFEQLGKHPTCREDSNKPDHRVQELLILEKIGPLLSHMEEWSSDNGCGPQMLRFFAHLVLVLRLMGHSDISGDNVIQAYVKHLINLRDPRLVAHYVAQLPQEVQINNYASFLATVVDAEERQACLDEADQAGLDVESITTTVVEMIRKQESKCLITSETTASDLKKISALDWLVIYPAQRAEALWQANALMRSFLTAGKVDAATKAFQKIPPDTISHIVDDYQLKSNGGDIHLHENLPRRVASSIKEYFCYKVYLDAKEGFSDWHQHFHNAKPSKPADPGENASFHDRVAYDHRLKGYNQDLERWKKTMQIQTKTVRSLLHNVLVFPPDGWLVDSTSGQPEHTELVSDQDKLREREMEYLRAQCIPEIVLLFHTVLYKMEDYAECIRLADLIVSEQYQLYRVYARNQLRELMVKIADASLALLEQKKDPWGLPLSS